MDAGTAGDVLALHGGTPAVSLEGHDTWERIPAEAVKRRIGELLDQGIITLSGGGGVIGEFEAAFRELAGTEHALCMNSGTASLHSAYFAADVRPGTEVLVPSYTWHATVTPVLHCSATPVFCDIEPDTLVIDPEDVERKVTERSRAICVVHAWGNVVDMDAIMAIAEKHGLVVIEDASHAHGAAYKGRPVGGDWPHRLFQPAGTESRDRRRGGRGRDQRSRVAGPHVAPWPFWPDYQRRRMPHLRPSR